MVQSGLVVHERRSASLFTKITVRTIFTETTSVALLKFFLLVFPVIPFFDEDLGSHK